MAQNVGDRYAMDAAEVGVSVGTVHRVLVKALSQP